MRRVSDLNIASNVPLPAPALLLHEIPRTEAQEDFVAEARQHVREILRHRDPRLLLIVGPCSIHDVRAGREYESILIYMPNIEFLLIMILLWQNLYLLAKTGRSP